MCDESSHTTPLEHNIDYHIITLFERLEALRKDSHSVENSLFFGKLYVKRSMRIEIRTLDFWRSIISECLASFLYVFIVCGAAAGAGVGASVSSVLLATALASGLAMATLTQCFLHISGAHINPAVTLASCAIRLISPIRATMYVIAQCGGGIAGAALLYSITVPGYQGNLQAAIAHSTSLDALERFGVEFILTFAVVLSYFVSTDFLKKLMGNSPISIGMAYSACSFVSMPYLNPARSFGPAFVLNKWDHHWVYWFGPIIGGICAALIYQYVFRSERRMRHGISSNDNDSSSVHSEDDLNCDLDTEKSNMQSKYSSTLQRNIQLNSNIQNLYSAQPHMGKLEQIEPIYDGAHSMYSRTPTMPRSSLSRSQSVYTKNNATLNSDAIQRSGPLMPAQNIYPIRLPHSQAQMTSQVAYGNDTFYTIRNVTKASSQQQQHHHPNSVHQPSQQDFQKVYVPRQTSTPNEVSFKFERRPEIMYGLTVQRNRGHSTQSDDSSYGSYLSSAITPPARINTAETTLAYTPPQPLQPDQSINTTTSMQGQPERKISLSAASSQPPPPPPAFASDDNFIECADTPKSEPMQSSL